MVHLFVYGTPKRILLYRRRASRAVRERMQGLSTNFVRQTKLVIRKAGGNLRTKKEPHQVPYKNYPVLDLLHAN